VLLKCSSCERIYKSEPEDFGLELTQTDYSSLNGKIFFGRYGTDLNGRHIDYVFCAGCSHITMVIPDAGFGFKLILGLLGQAFPYKPYSAPINLFDVHDRINHKIDSSGKKLQTIFKEGFILPPHIFELLIRLKVFEIAELGLLMYGRNCYADDTNEMSFGNYVSAVKNDVINRKKQIAQNLGSADTENTLQEFNRACACFQTGKYKEAISLFSKAAQQGHAHAQNNIAEMYRAGQGVAQNENEAIKWFRKAAEQGIPNAQNNLGLACKTGEGTKQSDSEAVFWFRKAAEQDDYEADRGISEAQCNLGMMYFVGQGVTRSDSEAVFWFRKAAEQGISKAQEYIEKIESIIRDENKNHNASEETKALIKEDGFKNDNHLDCLSDFIKMGSEEDHVFARILEDLVKARSFADDLQIGENDRITPAGTSDWAPSMLMAYGYAMRAAAAALYFQGVYSESDYLTAKTVFTGLQLQTDQTVEFQDNAMDEAIEFIAQYVQGFDHLFARSLIGTAETGTIIPGEFIDDDELISRMEQGRKPTKSDFSANWSFESKMKLQKIVGYYKDEEFTTALMLSQVQGQTSPIVFGTMKEIDNLIHEICDEEGMSKKELQSYLQGTVSDILAE
jgi:tetratricopeptide (TPR) repeat protein